MITLEASIRDNLSRAREAVASAARAAGRDESEVRIVAVSKTQPPDAIAAAAAAGQRLFGENRIQEAAGKIPVVKQLVCHPLEWHLIGTLQRNKAKVALSLFDILESVDSVRLAETLNRLAEGRVVPILLEVELGDDFTRPGFRPDELRDCFPALLDLPGLEIRGLMTVAPLGIDALATRRIFAALRGLREDLEYLQKGARLPELSMGMSEDFEAAIAEGATIVRLGRAIFGARPS